MTSRKTADKVRPILEAMERSINRARNRRVHGEEEPQPQRIESTDESPRATPTNPVANEERRFGTAQPMTNASNSSNASSENGAGDETPRLKAKPKRPTAFNSEFNSYRSHAG